MKDEAREDPAPVARRMERHVTQEVVGRHRRTLRKAQPRYERRLPPSSKPASDRYLLPVVNQSVLHTGAREAFRAISGEGTCSLRWTRARRPIGSRSRSARERASEICADGATSPGAAAAPHTLP